MTQNLLIKNLLIIYLLNICLAACGQKGPLRLPDNKFQDIDLIAPKELLHK